MQLAGIGGSPTQVLTTDGVLDQVGTASSAGLVSPLSNGFQVTFDTLDAAGRMLVRTLSAQVNGQTVSRVLEEATYDDAGRTLTRKNEFGGVTTTADTLVSGQRLVTVTNPALGTTVEEYWRELDLDAEPAHPGDLRIRSLG